MTQQQDEVMSDVYSSGATMTETEEGDGRDLEYFEASMEDDDGRLDEQR